MGWDSFELKVSHTLGHSMDVGNLEIDWEVGWTLDWYLALNKRLNSDDNDWSNCKILYTLIVIIET